MAAPHSASTTPPGSAPSPSTLPGATSGTTAKASAAGTSRRFLDWNRSPGRDVDPVAGRSEEGAMYQAGLLILMLLLLPGSLTGGSRAAAAQPLCFAATGYCIAD